MLSRFESTPVFVCSQNDRWLVAEGLGVPALFGERAFQAI